LFLVIILAALMSDNTVAITDNVSRLYTPAKKGKTPRLGGGRSTSGGVGYEVQLAVSLAVKMLGGSACSVWDAGGDHLEAITMQDMQPVDDVVVELKSPVGAIVYLSAKHRGKGISLTLKNNAFGEVVESFVRQFQKMSPEQRLHSRLLWAVPASAGKPLTEHLCQVLEDFRRDDMRDLADFINRRSSKEEKAAFEKLVDVTQRVWKKEVGVCPPEPNQINFLRLLGVHVFDPKRDMEAANEKLRGALAVDPPQAPQILKNLEVSFGEKNRRGLRCTAASLRRELYAAGLFLNAPPDYKKDVEFLRRQSGISLNVLKTHNQLAFKNGAVHISREVELEALLRAVKDGNLLITGEPGSGKSGLVHSLASKLTEEKIPVILLLAEDYADAPWPLQGDDRLPGMKHPLVEVLQQWPEGEGMLITDALDALRDGAALKRMRNLLQDVAARAPGWRVVASVREFDLMHGRDLRDAFPGAGVPGFASKDFRDTAHFHVPALTDKQLDDSLLGQAPEIRPFVEGSRNSARAEALHRSPFYLRLAAELLRDGALPHDLADWTSPRLLLKKFWQARVPENQENALKLLCLKMVQARQMKISRQALPSQPGLEADIKVLRKAGVLQAPIMNKGMPLGENRFSFSHHLLHDYAITHTLFPETPGELLGFLAKQPMMPVLYRHSTMMAMEILWEGDRTREDYWKMTVGLEAVASLHLIARVTAPALAARRVAAIEDLLPLLDCLDKGDEMGTQIDSVFRHLIAGVQDAEDAFLQGGLAAWSEFADRLSQHLNVRPALESPVVLLCDRLASFIPQLESVSRLNLNQAAGRLMSLHASKEVLDGWRYAARAAIQIVCQTFELRPEGSLDSLRLLLKPERLVQFPHWDLLSLSANIEFLPTAADPLVRTLYEVVFNREPESDELENVGNKLLGLYAKTKDNWEGVRYSLAKAFEKRGVDNPALITHVVCLVWAARDLKEWRDHERSNTALKKELGEVFDSAFTDLLPLASLFFRGVECSLPEVHRRLSGSSPESNSGRILRRFGQWLDHWCQTGNAGALDIVLDSVARKDTSAEVWQCLLEKGATYPNLLGIQLQPLLKEPLFLDHYHYGHEAMNLFGSLHKAGDAPKREELEKIVMMMDYDIQDTLLGVLDESDLVLPELKELRHERIQEGELPKNLKYRGMMYSRGGRREAEEKLEQPADLHALRKLHERLQTVVKDNDENVDLPLSEDDWLLLTESEQACHTHQEQYPDWAQSVWCALVTACQRLVWKESWPAQDDRWQMLRRILLRTWKSEKRPQHAEEPDDDEGGNMVFDSSPRDTAISGLIALFMRLEGRDEALRQVLRESPNDQDEQVRILIARSLHHLRHSSPDLMWEIYQHVVDTELDWQVLAETANSLSKLWTADEKKSLALLHKISELARSRAPEDDYIYDMLAAIFLFRYLRDGTAEGWNYVTRLHGECDKVCAATALEKQFHDCRTEGWLLKTDAETESSIVAPQIERTWDFWDKTLTAAQLKLHAVREEWQFMHANSPADKEKLAELQSRINAPSHLLYNMAMQLFFMVDEKNGANKGLDPKRKRLFWKRSQSLFWRLADEQHPQTIHYVIQALFYLLPVDPCQVFLTLEKAVQSGRASGYQFESMASDKIVEFVQLALADYKEIFQRALDGEETKCMLALLRLLDVFVDAGWPKARKLIYRLEEIYR
jgi:hypothetical protein